MRTGLVDADIVIYRHAFRNQKDLDFVVKTDIDKARKDLDADLRSIKRKLKLDQLIICLSDKKHRYWRHDIFPDYKPGRGGTRPELLGELRIHMRDNYQCFVRPKLEADDIMGILATHPTLVPGKKIIISTDKDMLTIPGWTYRYGDPDAKPHKQSEWEADKWHMMQTLTGDSTDGYPGCPNVGPIKATEALWGVLPDDFEKLWETVVSLFIARGLSETDALLQARLARICRAGDYAFHKKEVILWTP